MNARRIPFALTLALSACAAASCGKLGSEAPPLAQSAEEEPVTAPGAAGRTRQSGGSASTAVESPEKRPEAEDKPHEDPALIPKSSNMPVGKPDFAAPSDMDLRGFKGSGNLAQLPTPIVADEKQKLDRIASELDSTTPRLVARMGPAKGGEGDDSAADAAPTGLAGLMKIEAKEEERAEDTANEALALSPKTIARTDSNARDDRETFRPPETLLPRMFYFEPTYLGGSAAYAERLRRLDAALGAKHQPYRLAFAEAQAFDPPPTAGLGLTATIDTTHIEKARRVFLQVGLQGSSRHGWRRPPLDAVLVIDAATLARGRAFIAGFAIDLVRRLGSADRLGVVIAGAKPERFLEIARLETAQQQLAYRIESLDTRPAGDLGAALETAGEMLHAASDVEYIVPGTQTIFVLTEGGDPAQIASASAAAHELTLQGAVTSVFALDADEAGWWQVANAGHGNLHRVRQTDFSDAIAYELASIARVVARLVRVNVRLGKDAQAIRVLGTRVLRQDEVDAVKAREVATDLNISKTLGVTSDRGGDDDGVQTVIPYFYGDDSHVILIELWVEKPGVVADVTVRYKDMVNLENATARASVLVSSRPGAETPEQRNIARNVRGFELAESLQVASERIERNDGQGALQALEKAGAMAATTNSDDASAVEELRVMINDTRWQASPAARSQMAETLLISGQRRVGDTKK